MDPSDHSRAEALVCQLWETFTLDSPVFLEVIIEPLDLNGRQFVQHDFPDTWNDVVLNIVCVVFFCIWPDTRLGVNLIPCPLPQCHCVIPGLGDVDWGKYVSALTDIGYNGYTCIEVEDRAFEDSQEDIINSLRLSKRYMEQFVI